MRVLFQATYFWQAHNVVSIKDLVLTIHLPCGILNQDSIVPKEWVMDYKNEVL